MIFICIINLNYRYFYQIIDIINDTMLAIKKCTVIIILKEFVCIDINVSYGIARHCTTFRCKFNIRIRRDTAFFVT